MTDRSACLFRYKMLKSLFAGGLLFGSGVFTNCDGRAETLFLEGYNAEALSRGFAGVVSGGLIQATQNVVDGVLERFTPPPAEQ